MGTHLAGVDISMKAVCSGHVRAWYLPKVQISHSTTPNDHLKMADKSVSKHNKPVCQLSALHIWLCSEDTVFDGLQGHPAKWHLPTALADVHFSFSWQAKVCYFQHLILANQDIPAGQISMDNAQTGKVALEEEGR